MSQYVCRFLLLAIIASRPALSSNVFAVSDDASFVSDQFSSVNYITLTVGNIAQLGDGSLGFNGGLTAGPGGFLYAIANDFSGASSFFQIQPGTGAASPIGSPGGLGFGFLGGLTFDSADGLFYAAVNDSSGDSSLYSITASGVATAVGQDLGTGFSGLAYDGASGLFYGIGNDSTGLSTLYDFSPGGSINSVVTLGYGYGGLTYDPAFDAFWAIQGVNAAGSTLMQVSPAGLISAPVMTLGDGFVELAVETPEPGPLTEVVFGLLLTAAVLRLRKRKSQLIKERKN